MARTERLAKNADQRQNGEHQCEDRSADHPCRPAPFVLWHRNDRGPEPVAAHQCCHSQQHKFPGESKTHCSHATMPALRPHRGLTTPPVTGLPQFGRRTAHQLRSRCFRPGSLRTTKTSQGAQTFAQPRPAPLSCLWISQAPATASPALPGTAVPA